MNKKFLKIFFSMTFVLILGKGLGFVRTTLVASCYGAGFTSDLYSFEDSLINEIYSIFSSFLSCTFIPKYLALDEKKRNRLFSLLLNFGMVLMIVLMIVFVICTEPILKILVPGFYTLYDINYIVLITRINMIMLLLTFLINYFLTVLQAHEMFIYLTLESLFLNIVLILYMLICPQYEILGLIICRILVYLVFLILLIVVINNKKLVRYIPYFNLKDTMLMSMLKEALPVLGITILWQLNYIIDKSMASGLASGSIACLNYANVISMLIYNVVGYIVSTYAYPMLSKMQKDENGLNMEFNKYFGILLNLVFPICIVTAFFSNYVCDLLYGHGEMTISSVNIVSIILILYLPGSVAYCIKNLFAKIFYIKEKVKVVFIIDIMSCLINIVLNLLLVKKIGVYGLALATSIAYIFSVILQISFVQSKRYVVLELKVIRNILIKIVFACLFALLMKNLFILIPNYTIMQLVFVAVVYIMSCIFFNWKELMHIMQGER